MTLKVLIGIIVAILIIFAILPLFNNLLKALPKNDSSIDFFSNLVDEVNSLKNNEQKSVLFSISSRYSIVGFKKDSDFIGIGTKQNCGDFSLTKINKPAKFKDKGAICLCSQKLLEDDFNACGLEEESKCVEIEDSIIDDKNPCGYFVLEGKSNKNLKIKKQDNLIIINKE